MFAPDHPVIKTACDQARLAFDRGETAEALHILALADCQWDGDKPILTLHRAEFELASGHQVAAIASMNRALQMAPFSGNVHVYVRTLLEKCEDSEQTAFLSAEIEKAEAASTLVWAMSEEISGAQGGKISVSRNPHHQI
ncbi:MAG: hypothetical protein AB7E85_02295 [Pseudobdellovibrionaceae bacterium]